MTVNLIQKKVLVAVVPVQFFDDFEKVVIHRNRVDRDVKRMRQLAGKLLQDDGFSGPARTDDAVVMLTSRLHEPTKKPALFFYVPQLFERGPVKVYDGRCIYVYISINM